MRGIEPGWEVRVFSATLPMIFPSTSFGAGSPWYWPVAAELILVYAILGAASGVAIVATLRVLRRPAEEQEEHASLFTLLLVATFLVSLVTATTEGELGWSSVIPPLLLFGLLGSGAVVGAPKGFELLANPLIASLCLVLPLWLIQFGFWNQLVVGSGSLVGLVGALVFIGRKTIVSHQKADRLLWRLTLPVTGILLIAQLCSVLVLGADDGLNLDSLRSAGQQQPGRPNVLVVTMDTTRADHFSIYGYGRETSPNLKELANGAVVYTNATAAGSMTLSSHASIFTGYYPSWHGAHVRKPGGFGQALGAQFDTMAEILAREGYQTAAVVANTAYLNSAWGMDQGFQVYSEVVPLVFLQGTSRDAYLLRFGVARLLDYFTNTSHFYRVNRTAAEISTDARAIVSSANQSNKPFFLFVNYMDAHEPYLPPAGFDRAFAGKMHDPGTPRNGELLNKVLAGQRELSERVKRHVVSQYDGSIAYVDQELATLVAHLRDLRLFENTLIIVTSDHGEAFGEHGLFDHGVSVYADQVHVPLLIKYPARRASDTIEATVSHVDLLPTVLDVVKARERPLSQGRSLDSGQIDAHRAVFAESPCRPIHHTRHTS